MTVTRPSSPWPSGDHEVESSIVDNVSRAVVQAYDLEYGGFGSASKVPLVSAVELLLHVYRSTGDTKYRSMVEGILDGVMNGGLNDRKEGGFFGYTITNDRSGRHPEKSLAGNVDLLGLYTRTYLVTGDEKYGDVASGIAGYVNGHLLDPSTGAFYGGQDADERYYLLPLDQRQKHTPPGVDSVFYTGKNAKAASAYLEAAWILSRPELANIALGTLKYLLEHCRERPLRNSYSLNGEPDIPAFLADYAHLVVALVDAYGQTSRGHYLDEARRLAGEMIDAFWDGQDGGFYNIAKDPQAIGGLEGREKPLPDNAVAIEALVGLFYSTYDKTYRGLAGTALGAFVPLYQSYGESAASYALAVDRFLHSPVEISVLGMPGDSSTKALMQAAATIPYPHTAIKFVDSSDEERVAQTGYWAADEPLAFVCLDTVCLAPIGDPESLRRTVAEFLESGSPGTGSLVQSIGDIL